MALYIVYLLDSGSTYSSVSSSVYSIKWAYEMCGKLDPANNAFVKNLVDSAKRKTKFPVKKKDPVTSNILIK